MSNVTMASAYLPYITGEIVDNSSAQTAIVKVSIAFIVLILITAGMRFWVRLRMLRSSGLDDIFMVVGLIFALLLCASSLIGEHFGLGKHVWNLTPVPSDIPHYTSRVTKALYGCYLAYTTAISFTKFSIIATCFRIFSPGIHRKILVGIGAVVAAFWVASIFAIIFTCVPFRAAWDYTVQGKCYPVVDFYYAFSAFNVVTDILLCILPIPTLWALRMPKIQRVILCILFSMGTFACVASILRITQLHHLSSGFDFTYQTSKPLIWSIIEVGTALICASISALRPLAAEYLPMIFSHFSQDVEEIPHTPEPPEMTNRASAPPVRRPSTQSFMSEIYVQHTITQETTLDTERLPHLPIPTRVSSQKPKGRRPQTSFLLERTSSESSGEHGVITIRGPDFEVFERPNSPYGAGSSRGSYRGMDGEFL